MTVVKHLSLLDYNEVGEEDPFSTYQFRIIENSGGGSCLFKALAQCKNNWHESNHALERKKIVDFAISEENWPSLKEFLVGQHAEEIPGFKDESASDVTLRKDYSEYMSKDDSYGTMSELEIASRLTPDQFNFSVLRRDDSTYSVSVQNSITPNAKQWFYFLFTGPMSSGHWEQLEPTFFEREIHKELPQGIFLDVGYEKRHLFMSNQESIKPVPKCRRCSPIIKLKNFASAAKRYWKSRIPTILEVEHCRLTETGEDMEPESDSEVGILSTPTIQPEIESRKRVRFDLEDSDQSGVDGEPPVKEKRKASCEVDPRPHTSRCGQRHVSKPHLGSSSKCCPSPSSPVPVSDTAAPSILLNRPSQALQYSFKGSRIVIFGGSNGIGGQLARTLFEDKAEVLMIDGDKKQLNVLRNANPGLMTLALDYKEFEDVKEALKSVDPFIHMIIVSKLKSGDVLELAPGTGQKLFDCVTTSIPIINYFVDEMSVKGVPCNMERTIVHLFEEDKSLSTNQNNSAFEVSSKTMSAFTKSIAQNLLPKKVRLNSLRVVPTELSHISQCSGRNLEMSAINATLYLSSQMSELIFGETITVDNNIH